MQLVENLPFQKILVVSILSLSSMALTNADTSNNDAIYYDAAGRVLIVDYDDGSVVSYEHVSIRYLLAIDTTPANPTKANSAPEVAIVGGSTIVSDTDGYTGEIVSLSATAKDTDGTIASTEWLIGNAVVASGLTPDILLPDGQTTVTFKAIDDDGDISSDEVTITVNAPPLEEGWPAPYGGITPDESLGLGLNNIGALSPQDGLIYTCLRMLVDGEQSAFEGIERYDIALGSISREEGADSCCQRWAV